jgi:hypothetical protein
MAISNTYKLELNQFLLLKILISIGSLTNMFQLNYVIQMVKLMLDILLFLILIMLLNPFAVMKHIL